MKRRFTGPIFALTLQPRARPAGDSLPGRAHPGRWAVPGNKQTARRKAMFDKNAKPSPQRQQQLDKYRQLVDRFSPKSNFSQGLLLRLLGGRNHRCRGRGLRKSAAPGCK